MKLTAILLVIFSVTCLQSCGTKNKPIEPNQLNGYWVLKTLDGKDVRTLFEGTIPGIQFDFDKMLLTGSGGCNNFTGQFTFEKEKNLFSAPNLVATMRLCVEKNEEGLFFEKLSKQSILSLDKDILKFTTDNYIVMEFEKGEAPKNPSLNEKLTGTWQLKNIDGKTATEIFSNKYKEDYLPTLIFNFDENKINGNAGCNNYSTSFAINNGVLIVSPIATTKMACPNLAGEAQYIKNLSDTTGLAFQGESSDTLQLRKKGNLVLEYVKIK